MKDKGGNNMLFFYPMDLTHGMGRFSNKLKKMGEFLTTDHNIDIANKFFEYCQNYDCENVDKMLEKAFQSFLGYDNILTGLNELANKFPELNIDISSAVSEKEKILLLAGYADKMLEIIKKDLKENQKDIYLREFVVIFSIILIVIIIVAVVILMYRQKNNKKMKKPRFTKEDKVAVELIKILAEVLNSIDDFIRG